MYYLGFLIRLTPIRTGNWRATVSPLRGEGGLAAANPDEEESVGEFLTREAAVDAARQHIHEKQLRNLVSSSQHSETPTTQGGPAPSLAVTVDAMSGSPERRRMRRLPVGKHIPARAHGTIPVRLVDLSLGGARIEHLSQLRPGFPCALEIPPPAGPLSLATHVVRSRVVGNRRRAEGDRHFRYESGLAFSEVTAEQEMGLTRLLEWASGSD